ncbi:uncharacterized protein LOC108092457 isoform X2 [Drosophila ficusphila]|nr:uncharacterized protein LOC108092457 isoform X2 [Drosophila ficusphila]XP_017047535.1 uncharacterized protein LOC108092457 isoform X2 [Drosophila ficusphila]
MNNQLLSGNRGGPSNGDQWQPMQMQDEVRGPPDHISDAVSALSGARRKWYYRYLNTGNGHEESLRKAIERRTNPSGFKGGALKWYDKYIDMGLSEKEARAKVLEYQKSHPIHRPEKWARSDRDRKRPKPQESGDRDRKRPKPQDSGDRNRKRPVENSRAKEEPKKQRRTPEGPPKAVGSNRKGFSIAVMAKNYPEVIMSKEQLTMIEAALVDEMRKGWKSSINFGGIEFLPGLILVVCLDMNSKQWLEQVVPKIKVVPGITLSSCRKNEIPATKGFTVLVPRSFEEPDQVTMDLLKDQNSDLLSKTWRLFRVSQLKDGKVLYISIGDKAFDLLQKKDLTVSYRFSQLSCRLISGKGALKALRATRTQALNKEAENAETAEIDLTEEDADEDAEEDISQLELTVVDEIRGDDDEEADMVDEQREEDENGEGELDEKEGIAGEEVEPEEENAGEDHEQEEENCGEEHDLDEEIGGGEHEPEVVEITNID